MDNASMMEEYSDADLLAEINKAIRAICIGGQSYKIGSRSLTRADLAKLYEIKNDLEIKAADSGGDLLGNCYVAVFDGR